jgi:hypothetical protein
MHRPHDGICSRQLPANIRLTQEKTMPKIAKPTPAKKDQMPSFSAPIFITCQTVVSDEKGDLYKIDPHIGTITKIARIG